MPVLDFIVNNLIKMYFNLNSKVNIGKKFTRRRNRARYRSATKVFVGNTEMKHFNDKIIVTIYTYNRTKKYIFKLLEELYKKIFRNNIASLYDVKGIFKKDSELYSENNHLYINNTIKKKLKKFLNRKYKLRFKLTKKNRRKKFNYRKFRKFYLIKTYKNLYLNNLINYGVINYNKYIRFEKDSNYENSKQINLNNIYLNLKLLSIYNKGTLLLKNFFYRYNTIFKLLKEKDIINLKELVNKKNFLELKKDSLKINKEYIKTKL